MNPVVVISILWIVLVKLESKEIELKLPCSILPEIVGIKKKFIESVIIKIEIIIK